MQPYHYKPRLIQQGRFYFCLHGVTHAVGVGSTAKDAFNSWAALNNLEYRAEYIAMLYGKTQMNYGASPSQQLLGHLNR